MGLSLAILAFDSLLGLVTTLGFVLAHWAPFWNLLLAWLTPLLLLTAISLPQDTLSLTYHLATLLLSLLLLIVLFTSASKWQRFCAL